MSTRWDSSARFQRAFRPILMSTGSGAIAEWFDHAIALGASGIALGPIFASRTHGYDTTDHYRIDPRLGDDDDFDYLIAEARRRGLRVLLDGVFNHVGVDFPRYREATNDDAAARWFRGRPGSFDTFEGHDGLLTLEPRQSRGRRLHRRRHGALVGPRC